MTGGHPAFNYSDAQCGTFVATSQPRFICVFIFSWWPLIFHKQIPGHFQDNSRTSMAGGHPAFNQTDMQCGTCAATSQPRFICVLSFNQTATFYLCFYLVIRWLRTVGHMWRQVNHVLFAFFFFSWWPLKIHKQIPGHFQDNSRTPITGGHSVFNQTDMQFGASAATIHPRFICVFIF